MENGTPHKKSSRAGTPMAHGVKANSNHKRRRHISTYARAATLYEVAFNHFFRRRDSKIFRAT